LRGEAAAQVAAFAAGLRWSDVPAQVRRRLALLLLDHAAVVEAGRAAPAARIAADHGSEAYGGDAATALYDGRRLSVPGAAWANGVLANVLDHDDGHRLTKGHPGAMVIPAALAVAESIDAPVEELVTAIAIGYEVAVRAGVAIHAREAQYHASASWGALGVVAAAGRLLGLDGVALRHALGLAEYHAPIALMPRAVADPAMTKDTCGWGCVIGTTAALLAARGFTALDGEFAQERTPLALGERWELLELYLKPYPCCRWTQPAIDAALALAPAAGDARIRAATVRTFAAAGLLSRRRPGNTEEMQYSLTWPVATALVRGAFGVEEVLGGFGDPAVAALERAITVVVEPAYEAAFPARRLAALELELADGRVLRGEPREAGGEPDDPRWEEIARAKARRHLGCGDGPVVTEPPAGRVGGRSRDGLAALLAYAGGR
jgi:2-methylcitrate dehydratase PrpD